MTDIRTPEVIRPRYDSDDNEPINSIRRRELAAQLRNEGRTSEKGTVVVPNEQFAGYVQSTAFSMSLSRGQIRALAAVEHAIDREYNHSAWPVAPNAMQALLRRGLIEEIGDQSEPHPGTWSSSHRVTRAGDLMLELLFEAGFVQHRTLRKPLPPPPPGWADPRPKLRPGNPRDAHAKWETLPSDREEQYGVETNMRDLL